MKIVYLPLDERPCNYIYPQLVSQLNKEIKLIIPPLNVLSKKKTGADFGLLKEWLSFHLKESDIFVCSLEMLLYGGLLSSRLHSYSMQELYERLEFISEIKEINPQINIFLEALIMRTPQYSSSDEEPEYYEQYGKEIFLYGFFKDKYERNVLTQDEQKNWSCIKNKLPQQYLDDYLERRNKNCQVIIKTLKLVEKAVIDFMIIPQDDSALFGFTAIDQKNIYSAVKRMRLQNKVHIYPGADEAGCTLLARAVNYLKKEKPTVFVTYSSLEGAYIVPIYEDRPLAESIKAHILAAGAVQVFSWQEADIILAVNTAGKKVEEAPEQENCDTTYSSWRNLRAFMQEITYYLEQNKKVSIADVAFGNGADIELIEMLDDYYLWDKIYAYAGWNTACNTLGTTICTAILGKEHKDTESKIIVYNKIYQLLEAGIYQAKVRGWLAENKLSSLGISYFDVTKSLKEINDLTKELILKEWQNLIRKSFLKWELSDLKVNRPWHRMFEISLDFKLKKR